MAPTVPELVQSFGASATSMKGQATPESVPEFPDLPSPEAWMALLQSQEGIGRGRGSESGWQRGGKEVRGGEGAGRGKGRGEEVGEAEGKGEERGEEGDREREK